jgi:hypothetical protein
LTLDFKDSKKNGSAATAWSYNSSGVCLSLGYTIRLCANGPVKTKFQVKAETIDQN